MDGELARLNSLPTDAARAELLKCCGSERWAEGVAARRPFGSVEELLETADRVWWSLGEEDWLEAFRAHPKIGERKAEAHQPTEARAWSEAEQSGARSAARETLAELAELNRAYEEKFGFIFIVCATGKTAGEMLAALRERVTHDADAELRAAAEEQRRITRLRIEKLLHA